MYIYGIDKNKQERGEFLMKLKGLLALLLTLSMTLLTACGAQTQPTEEKTATSDVQTVRVGVSGDFYPFCYKENDQLKGFEIDLWEQLAQMNNWKLEYTVADFSGLFGMLDTGKIDTVARQTSSDNQARREKYLFSDVYLYSTYNLVVKGDSSLQSLEDFKGKKIGVVMGGDGERNLKQLNEEQNLGIEIVGYEGTPAMDSDIELGRIDGRVAPMLQTKRNIEEKGQDFKITDHIVYVEAAAYVPLAHVRRGQVRHPEGEHPAGAAGQREPATAAGKRQASGAFGAVVWHGCHR